MRVEAPAGGMLAVVVVGEERVVGGALDMVDVVVVVVCLGRMSVKNDYGRRMGVPPALIFLAP